MKDEILSVVLPMEALQKRSIQHSYNHRSNREENKKQRGMEEKSDLKAQM